MPQLEWTAPALSDLRAINIWLHREVSGEFAIRTLGLIRLRAEFLLNFPHGGRPTKQEVRVLRVFGTRYLLLYRLLDDAVQIVRVQHEREDWLIER